MSHSKLTMLALAVSSVLSGTGYAGHEIVGESKQQIIEPTARVVAGDVSAGYWSKYIFRGTNLTPDSDGLVWAQAFLTVHPWESGTFTFGVWVGSQMGAAQVGGAERIGEAGGGAVPSSPGNRGGQAGSIGASNDPVIIKTANDLNDAFARDLNNPNGVTGDDFIEYLKDEYKILGVPPGDIRDGNRNTVFGSNDAQSSRDMRDLIRARTGKGIPNQITRFKTTNETIQDRFTEIDATAEYRHDFGPIEVAIGNIFFYIDRESKSIATIREFFASDKAREFIKDVNFDRTQISGSRFVSPILVLKDTNDFLVNQGKTIKFKRRSTGDEMFDRAYIDLSTNLLTKYYGIKPHLTYYQTFLNEGESGDSDLQTHRYDTRGGYIDFKVAASIPVWKEEVPGAAPDFKGDGKSSGKAAVGEERIKLSIDPSFRVSYSVRDRASADGTPLTGFNHLQAGLQMSWHVTDNFSLVPEINYARHLGAPTLGTDRDEWWGGGRAEFRF